MVTTRAIAALFGAAAILLCSTACEHQKTAAEKKAEVEKVWRAKQKVSAAKYYQELIERYPDSPFAAKARQQLEAMGPVPGTPKPANGGTPHQ